MTALWWVATRIPMRILGGLAHRSGSEEETMTAAEMWRNDLLRRATIALGCSSNCAKHRRDAGRVVDAIETFIRVDEREIVITALLRDGRKLP